MPPTDQDVKDFLGAICLKKASGEIVNGYALTTQKNIPYTSYSSQTLENNFYPGAGNAAAGPVIVAPGKKVVMHTIEAPCHPGWYEQKLINDLIGGTAGFLNRNEQSVWDLSRYEPILGHKRFTTTKLSGISTVHNADGQAISCVMNFISLYPQEEGSPATFATPTALTGQAYGPADFTSTSFDYERSCIISIVRGLKVQNVGDGTRYGLAISTRAMGGTFTLEEIPTAEQGTLLAATSGTQYGTAVIKIGASTTGVQWTLYVNRDTRRYSSQGNQPGTMFFDYSLADINNAGGTTYPMALIAAP